MKKTSIAFLILGVVIIFSLGMLFSRFFFGGTEDSWICENGEWIKHGNPISETPKEECEKTETTAVASTEPLEPEIQIPETQTPEKTEEVKITNIKANDTVSSPLEIKGEAPGTWFSEGSIPVKLVDSNKKIIASTSAEAQGEWMTESLVQFKATLKFDNQKATGGFIVIQKDNPSGLPQNNAEFKMPVTIAETKPAELTIKVFFQNANKNPNIQDCGLVFSVTRTIQKTQSTARAALEELFKGPTENEKNLGYFTSINEGVKIQKLSIVDGVAKVDFNEKLEENVGGSCKTGTIIAQIKETLKQFSSVKTVIISINGQTENILQP